MLNFLADLLLGALESLAYFIADRINPVVGARYNNMMNGHVLHETLIHADGCEEHLFHCDPTIRLVSEE